MSGAQVVKGEPLATLERSSDHNELLVRAPCDGVILKQNIRKEQKIVLTMVVPGIVY
jgi:hypothetical protein